MKVIFLQDVRGHGKRGEVKNVSAGYAQNYLIPQKKAKIATKSSISELNAQKRAEEKQKQIDIDNANKIKSILENSNTIVTIHSKSGNDGRLFGSVTSKQIAKELYNQYSIKIDKRKINLLEPIKSLGYINVSVQLFSGIESKIRVHVI